MRMRPDSSGFHDVRRMGGARGYRADPGRASLGPGPRGSDSRLSSKARGSGRLVARVFRRVHHFWPAMRQVRRRRTSPVRQRLLRRPEGSRRRGATMPGLRRTRLGCPPHGLGAYLRRPRLIRARRRLSSLLASFEPRVVSDVDSGARRVTDDPRATSEAMDRVASIAYIAFLA